MPVPVLPEVNALSLIIIIVYYILLSMGEGLGDGGYIPPMIAMWIPNLVLASIGVYLTIKIHRDSPFRLVPLQDRVHRVFDAQNKAG